MKYRTGLILVALAGSALATDPRTLSQGYATQARCRRPAFPAFPRQARRRAVFPQDATRRRNHKLHHLPHQRCA